MSQQQPQGILSKTAAERVCITVVPLSNAENAEEVTDVRVVRAGVSVT